MEHVDDTPGRGTRRRRAAALAAAAGLAAVLAATQLATGATPYESAVLADSPGVYYRVNEAPGALFATDVSTTDSTKRRDAHYSGGQLGQPGATTDGDKAAKDVTMTASFTDENEHTVEFWIKDAAQTSNTIMLHGIDQLATQGTVGSGWQLYTYASGGQQRLAILLGGQDVDLPCAAPSGSAWQHYVVSWSGDTVNCYLNGVAGGSRPTARAIDTATATPTFVVSARATIDEIALYSATLAEGDAARHFHTALRPFNTSAPGISGALYGGETLRATTGGWRGDGIAFKYQWLRCTSTSGSACSAIAGATQSAYVVDAADVGKRLAVQVVAENEHGAVGKWSPITGIIGPAIEAPNPYSKAVLADRPETYYRFTEAPAATKARNWAMTGSSYDGSFADGTRGVAGPLNLIDTAVDRPSITASTSLVENALEFFARAGSPAELGPDQVYVSHGSVSGTTPIDGWLIYRAAADDMLHFAYRFPLVTGTEIPAGDVILCDAPSLGLAWQHYAVTWSAGSDGRRTASCYLNGKKATDVELTGNWSINESLYANKSLRIDAPAAIDEFATYRSLTPTQVASHFAAAEQARAVVSTPAVTGDVTDAAGAPVVGVVGIFLSPFEAAPDAPEGAQADHEVVGTADIGPTGAYSIVPRVTQGVRDAAAANGGIVNLTWVARGVDYSIVQDFSLRLVGDHLHPMDAGMNVGRSNSTMNGSADEDGPGVVIYEVDPEDVTANEFGSAGWGCGSEVVQRGTAHVKTGETHTWANEGVRFTYGYERREETKFGIAIKRGDRWHVGGDVTRRGSAGVTATAYHPEYRSVRYSTQWTFTKYRHTGVCGRYHTIRPGYWTGGSYGYGIGQGLTGNCSTTRYRSTVDSRFFRHWGRTSHDAVDYSAALEVFGVSTFKAQSGYSTNVRIEYTLSRDTGLHYYCGDGEYPSRSRIVYAGF
jgi:hypothetical protein